MENKEDFFQRPYKYVSKYSISEATLIFINSLSLKLKDSKRDYSKSCRYVFTIKCCGSENSEDLFDSQSIKSSHVKTKTFTTGVSLESFGTYFSCFLFSIVASVLFSLIVWSLSWKWNAYIYFMHIKMDTLFFALPAAFLSLPMIYLTKFVQNNVKRILMLVAIQIVAAILLFTGYFLGTAYQLKYFNETLRLTGTIPTESLNVTLYRILEENNSTSESYDTIDHIQVKFKCCGVQNKDDYIITPMSCYISNKNDIREIFPWGCLRMIKENVAWHQNITLSITQIFLLMYFFHMAMVLTVFISNHFKWKDIENKR